MRLFSTMDDDTQKELEINAIHDDLGYKIIKEQLSNQYNLSMNEPNIQVFNVNVRGDRSLTLHHIRHDRRPLEKNNLEEVLKHLHRLWKFDVILKSIDGDKVINTYHCPEKEPENAKSKRA